MPGSQAKAAGRGVVPVFAVPGLCVVHGVPGDGAQLGGPHHAGSPRGKRSQSQVTKSLLPGFFGFGFCGSPWVSLGAQDLKYEGLGKDHGFEGTDKCSYTQEVLSWQMNRAPSRPHRGSRLAMLSVLLKLLHAEPNVGCRVRIAPLVPKCKCNFACEALYWAIGHHEKRMQPAIPAPQGSMIECY